MENYSSDEIGSLLDQLNRIKDVEVRRAFLFLITDAKTRSAYDVRPGTHGYIPDFRYYRQEKWLYAFIPNQRSLLWYFRRPLLTQVDVDFSFLETEFAEVSVTNGKEISVRIHNYDDAKNITKFLL
jgi:hypothetical protein